MKVWWWIRLNVFVSLSWIEKSPKCAQPLAKLGWRQFMPVLPSCTEWAACCIMDLPPWLIHRFGSVFHCIFTHYHWCIARLSYACEFFSRKPTSPFCSLDSWKKTDLNWKHLLKFLQSWTRIELCIVGLQYHAILTKQLCLPWTLVYLFPCQRYRLWEENRSAVLHFKLC